MSSKVKTSFTISQPIERVWDKFTDLPTIVKSTPGVRIIRQLSPKKYEVEAQTDLSFVESTYVGEIGLTDKDQEQYKISFAGQGKDLKRQDEAELTVDSQLSPRPEGTDIDISMRINIIDKPAAYNEQHIDYAAGQLLQTFAENFEQLFDSEEEVTSTSRQTSSKTFSDVNVMNTATDEPPATLMEPKTGPNEKSLLKRIAQFFSF
ncbi:MAG TPA: SRPBCC domain-containing protein [Saprospiraceae bacterium]|nr:SRPBCC domain-containing protein [Saprospiraceae bacterium]